MFLLVASIAAAPLIIPTLLAPGSHNDGLMFGSLVFMLMSMLYVGVYLLVGVAISVALSQWRKNGSAARSVLVGLGIGLLLGAGSCTAYLTVTS